MLALLAGGLLAGCQPAATTVPGPAAPAASSAEVYTDVYGRETWDVCLIGDARVGYIHTQEQPPDRAQGGVQTIQAEMRLRVDRFGQQLTQQVSLTSVERPDGRVLRFESLYNDGFQPVKFFGQPAGGKVITETVSAGQSFVASFPWTDRTGGFFAVEQSLRRRPMQPGEQRELTCLMPVFNRLAKVVLSAREPEPTELLDGPATLLRIESLSTINDRPSIASVLWTNAEGEVLKSSIPAAKQVMYRTSREVALGQVAAPALDLGLSSIVRATRPPKDPRRARRARYRATLDGPLDGAFVESASQRVTTAGPQAVEIVVEPQSPPSAAGPDQDAGPGLARDHTAPTDADREPCPLVQSRDQRVVSLAWQAASQDLQGWPLALALERYVFERVKNKGYSRAFASAAEVAQFFEGDCTEHSVLLIGLLRARQLPARAAMGLVYVDAPQPGFAYHMWTEVFVDGQWRPLDATLGQGGITAGHLKVTDTNLAQDDAYTSLLPVMRLLGSLKLDVIDVE